MVPAYDRYDMPIGKVDIADHEKLVTFLSYLKEYGNYRYILCDISFDENYKTEYDSLLYEIISSMPNIIIPKESGALPNKLRGVSASSGYKIFHHGDYFLKYQYLIKGERSIPLKMWYDLYGNDIYHHWWGFSSNNRFICNNATVLDLTNIIDYANQTKTIINGQIRMEKKLIYNLGADIIDAGCPRSLFENKIILIGDFYERDMHDTAIGQVPGIMLLYSAYQSLVDGRNNIPYIFYFILFCLFFVYSLFLMFGEGWKINDYLLAFCADSSTITTILAIFNYITFVFGGFAVNAVIIGNVFGLLIYLKKKINKRWKKS